MRWGGWDDGLVSYQGMDSSCQGSRFCYGNWYGVSVAKPDEAGKIDAHDTFGAMAGNIMTKLSHDWADAAVTRNLVPLQ